MKDSLSSYSFDEVKRSLGREGLVLSTGPFTYRIKSNLPVVAEGLYRLYQDHPVHDADTFADFNISLGFPSLWRSIVRPKVVFCFDYKYPFAPISPEQAYAFLEWGMNWCVAQYSNRYMKLHASVLEKNGKAIVMPGSPGAGKSTLCAALMIDGWRLLSDEFALISRESATLVPLCRPVGLKNESIDIIRSRSSDLVIGPSSLGTHKGTVAHLKPTTSSVTSAQVQAKPAFIVFPSYKEDGDFRLSERIKETTLIKTARQSFNYGLLGLEGFELMGSFVDQSECYNLSFSKLDDAVSAVNSLIG